MKKNRKGFTLIELLAVIIILAVIALITTPIILGIIENSKKESFKASAYGIIDAAEYLYARGILKQDEPTEETFVFPNDEELIFSGARPTSGVVKLNQQGKIRMAIYDGKYCVTKDYLANSVEIAEAREEDCVIYYKDASGANLPKFHSNMIPVYYDDSGWIYADIYNDEWYDYNEQQWANAVVLVSSPSKTYSVGDTILISDISQMYVWIPRYKYTIFNGNNGSVAAQEIKVVFESGAASTGTVSCVDAVAGSGTSSENCTDSTNGSIINSTSTYTQPAFKFGTEELTGIWVGKFESSNITACSAANGSVNSACDLTTLGIQIKPGVASWRGIRVSTAYTVAKDIAAAYSINADTHMIKNMEWGAVAYLSQSEYGKYGNSLYTGANKEIYQNKSTTYLTGNSNGTPSQSATNIQCVYDNITDRESGIGACGAGASTTGNIYGIYDMSGGSYEYAMGNVVTSGNVPMVGNDSSANSGFTGKLSDGSTFTGGTMPNLKYYNSYTYNLSNIVHSRGKLGEATKETLSTYGSDSGGWYGDSARLINASGQWSHRGGAYNSDVVAGIFAFFHAYGSSNVFFTFRVTIV